MAFSSVFKLAIDEFFFFSFALVNTDETVHSCKDMKPSYCLPVNLHYAIRSGFLSEMQKVESGAGGVVFPSPLSPGDAVTTVETPHCERKRSPADGGDEEGEEDGDSPDGEHRRQSLLRLVCPVLTG